MAFADDTFVTVTADSREDLVKKLESEGKNILDFFEKNRMIANADKTGLLILRPSTSKAHAEPISIQLCGSEIRESQDEKLLGVCIQNDIKWNKQINKVEKSQAKSKQIHN